MDERIKNLVNELRKGGTSLEDIWNAFDNAVEEAEKEESWRKTFTTIAEDIIDQVPAACWTPAHLATLAAMAVLERHPEWTKQQGDDYYVCVKEGLEMQENLVSAGPQGAIKMLDEELANVLGNLFKKGRKQEPKENDGWKRVIPDDEAIQKFLKSLGL